MASLLFRRVIHHTSFIIKISGPIFGVYIQSLRVCNIFGYCQQVKKATKLTNKKESILGSKNFYKTSFNCMKFAGRAGYYCGR